MSSLSLCPSPNWKSLSKDLDLGWRYNHRYTTHHHPPTRNYSNQIKWKFQAQIKRLKGRKDSIEKNMKFHNFGQDWRLSPPPGNCTIQIGIFKSLLFLNPFQFKIFKSQSILIEIPSFSNSILRLDIINSKSS